MQANEPYTISLIDPVTEIIVGETINYSAEIKDYDGHILNSCPVHWSVTGGGIINSDGIFIAKNPGNYLLTAVCGLASVSFPISLHLPASVETSTLTDISVEMKDKHLWVSGSSLKQILLYDLSGKMIYQKNFLNEDSYAVDIKNQKGIIVFVVKTSNQVKTGKVKLW